MDQETSVPGAPLRRAGSRCVDALLRLANQARNGLNDAFAELNISMPRHEVLAALETAGASGCTQADLAELLQQSESNVCTLVERLVVDRLVDRWPSPSDRRKRILALTPHGRELYKKLETLRANWAEQWLGRLPLDQQEQLAQALKLLAVAIEPHSSTLRENCRRKSLPEAPLAPHFIALSTAEAISPQAAIERIIELLKESPVC